MSISCIVFFSCDKNDTNHVGDTDLVIKAGFICGWGTGTDSIEITNKTIKYVYYIPSESKNPKIFKTRSVTSSEWAEIINVVNMNDFVKLYYQTCNVCFDGCDEWIFIKSNAISHDIRFTKGLKIDSINKLQTKLEQLRIEFNQ